MFLNLGTLFVSVFAIWWFYDQPRPWAWVCFLFLVLGTHALYDLLVPRKSKTVVLELAGMKWTREDFCRGWLVTVATGETLDLTGFYIVATSNIGAGNLMEMSETVPFRTLERVVFEQVDQQLRPELVGRFSEKLVFRRLTYEVQREICLKVIRDEQKRLSAQGYEVKETDEAIEFLLRAGIHKKLGARPMRDCVERNVQDAVALDLLSGGNGCGALRLFPSSHSLVLTREAT